MEITIRPLTEWTGERTLAVLRKSHAFTRPTDRWARQDMPWSDGDGDGYGDGS